MKEMLLYCNLHGHTEKNMPTSKHFNVFNAIILSLMIEQ